MANLIPPHGGKGLTCCLLEGAELEAEKKKAAGLKKIPISPREKGDLIMMGIGGFSPLTGFMTKADWKGVCDNYLMADGTFWPIPVTLSASKEDAAGIKVREFVVGERVVWDGRDATGRMVRSGLFFARLTAGSMTETRRFAMVE